ncbi:NTF2-related export protein [Frankliniella fusca]|uniref:NTF2-related export protein n=1 Tax=Frankliniella fusca TaxID=407009 RepID=A0AAE1LVB7_9NEOP|nr:NTF2-related export protein [Frankliniella fusca]
MIAKEQLKDKIRDACNVAEEFTKLYYESIDRMRHQLSRHYIDTAVLVWNGTGSVGKDQIQKFLEALPSSQHTVTSLDCQPVLEEAVSGQFTLLIQAAGHVHFGSGETKPFQQTFLITAAADKWKIVSDCFRLQEPIESRSESRGPHTEAERLPLPTGRDSLLHSVFSFLRGGSIKMGKKTADYREKREVPQVLQALLQLDVIITDKICYIVEKIVGRKWHPHYKALEISCHGIPWLAGWLAFIWLWSSPSLYQMQVNFYLGLLVDIFVVALLKAVTRRRRPRANQNDMFATVSVDKFSFPSGHATRACYIAHFFTCVYGVSVVMGIPVILWAIAVSLSRVLLRRHHVLDVTAGVFVGILESLFISYIWLSQEHCVWILSMITDEKLEGGEYHV